MILKHIDAAQLFKHELLKDPNIISVAPRNGGQWGTVAKLSSDSTIQFDYETVDEAVSVNIGKFLWSRKEFFSCFSV
jgi:hypothetical protein